MISKSCPKCDQQVPVACKACPCGHTFNPKRGSLAPVLRDPSPSTATDDGTVKRRRTERVKREKPNYYDALEYDNQMKKVQRKKTRKSLTEEDGRNHSEDRRKKKKSESEPERKEASPPPLIRSPKDELKCMIILAELNRRIGATSWHP